MGKQHDQSGARAANFLKRFSSAEAFGFFLKALAMLLTLLAVMWGYRAGLGEHAPSTAGTPAWEQAFYDIASYASAFLATGIALVGSFLRDGWKFSGDADLRALSPVPWTALASGMGEMAGGNPEAWLPAALGAACLIFIESARVKSAHTAVQEGDVQDRGTDTIGKVSRVLWTSDDLGGATKLEVEFLDRSGVVRQTVQIVSGMYTSDEDVQVRYLEDEPGVTPIVTKLPASGG